MKSRWMFATAVFMALQNVSYTFAGDLNSSEPKSRVEWIIEEKMKKARNLAPAEPHRIERGLYKYVGDNPLNKYMGGKEEITLKLGEMIEEKMRESQSFKEDGDGQE